MSNSDEDAGMLARIDEALPEKPGDARVTIATPAEPAIGNMKSDQVVLQAPMSFTGSAKRIWKMTKRRDGSTLVPAVPAALLIVAVAWVCVLAWYCVFGLLLVPYRLIRRGHRRDKRNQLQHQEMVSEMRRQRDSA